jgi:hypothetical protein
VSDKHPACLPVFLSDYLYRRIRTKKSKNEETHTRLRVDAED